MLGVLRRIVVWVTGRWRWKLDQNHVISNYGWWATIVAIAAFVLPLLQVTCVPIHELQCPNNFHHTDGVVQRDAASFENVSRLPTGLTIEHASLYEQWFNRVPVTEITDFTPDTTFNMGRLAGRALGYTHWRWIEAIGVLEVTLYPADVDGGDGHIKPDSASEWTYQKSSQIWIRWRPSWLDRTNRASMEYVNAVLCRELKPWLPNMHAAAITKQAVERLEYHNQHLTQLPWDRFKLLVSIVGLCGVLLMHTLVVRNVRRKFAVLFDRLHAQDLGLKPVSFIRLWLSWSHAGLERAYRKKVDQARRSFRESKKREQKEQLLIDITFDLLTKRLPAFVARLENRELPHGLQPYWMALSDSSADLSDRINALDMLERWLNTQRRVPNLPATDDRDYRRQLLDRVLRTMKSASGERRAMMQHCLDEFRRLESDTRVRLAEYWLERALADDEPESVVPAVSTAPVAAVVTGAPRPLRRLEDVVDLLQFADLLPDGVDHDHARAIIIWGCFHPGQRGRMMVNERYMTAQYVRIDVQNKLGSAFDPEQYEQALTFLGRVMVLLLHHKRKVHQPVIAFNPHFSKGIGVGQEIIKRALAAKSAIDQLVAM